MRWCPEILDLATPQLTPGKYMSPGRCDHSFAMLPDGEIILIGGIDNGNSLSSITFLTPPRGSGHPDRR